MHSLKLPLIGLTSLLLLSGCAKAVSNCPALREYTLAEQYRAADEQDALPPTSMLAEFMSDYAALRAQVRACR